MDKINNEQGLTLVELMVGMVIMVLILSGVVGILQSSTRSQTYAMGKGSDIQGMSSALDAIGGELEYALSSSVVISTTSAANDTITFVKVAGATGGKITRKIMVENNSVVIKESAYPWDNQDSSFSLKSSYGPGLVQSLTFGNPTIITSDSDMGSDNTRRKSIPVTLTATPINANDTKPITYRTTVTTANMQ